MGQEMSCTSRGKGFEWPGSFEEGFDNVVEGVERTADFVEQAIDDVTRANPAKVESSLSDKERSAAIALFWQLVREQGGNIAGVTAMVYEDAAMVLCLQRLCLIDDAAEPAVAGASNGSVAMIHVASIRSAGKFRSVHACKAM